jgi:hypothetical protein
MRAVIGALLTIAIAAWLLVPWTASGNLSYDQEDRMTWVKPSFEVLELASEVTAYRHHR